MTIQMSSRITMDKDSEKKSEIASQNEMSAVDCQQLDEADLNAMKGDTIGDTVYSAKWIINTLILLSKVHDDGWSKSLEDNLCMLWDMTAEKDIVHFLIDNDFIKIAQLTIKISKEPRLTEIILGIVGNMCCQPMALQAVANENNLVTGIFELLSTSDDPQTLIQISRLLQAAVWDIRKNKQTMWLQHLLNNELFGDTITFILKSSTNENLLIAAVDLLQLITIVPMTKDECLLDHLFSFDTLMPALMESFLQFMSIEEDVHSLTNLKFINNWLTIFSCIVQSYFDEISSRSCNEFDMEIIMKIIWRILQPYRLSGNIVPLDERAAVCIHDCVEIISLFQRNRIYPNMEIIHAIVEIFHELRVAVKADSQADSFTEPDHTIDELVKYLERYWLNTLSLRENCQLVEVLEMCNDSVMNSLNEVAIQYSKEFPTALEKLLHFQSTH